MKRTFNYTGRKKIPRDRVSVRLIHPAPPAIPSFEASVGDLSDLGLSVDARVFVDPYVGSSSMRFDFGRVGGISVPADLLLTDIDDSPRVLFRVLVVDDSAGVGKIVASADAIAPAGDDDTRDWLLPLSLRDLGDAVWELDLEKDSRPRLALNSRFPGMKERVLNDPLVAGSIFPHALRQVLAFLRENGSEQDDWVQDWRLFVESVAGESYAETIFDQDSNDVDSVIEETVKLFVLRRAYVTRAIKIEGNRADA